MREKWIYLFKKLKLKRDCDRTLKSDFAFLNENSEVPC